MIKPTKYSYVCVDEYTTRLVVNDAYNQEIIEYALTKAMNRVDLIRMQCAIDARIAKYDRILSKWDLCATYEENMSR